MEPPAAASSSPPYTLNPHPAAKKRTVAIESLEDICAGSIAGVVGKYIEYPFDTVKVRLQSQPDGRPLRYAGPLDCFRQSIRANGVIDGLYRGITAPLVGAALENSTMFFFERMGRELIYAIGGVPAEPAEQQRPLPLAALYLTGAFAGVLTSFVLTPIELVKCKIQAPAVAAVGAGTAAAALGAAPSPLPPLRPLAVIRDVYRHEGLLAFWHGQLGTLIREGGGGAAWFGAKETVTQLFRAHNARRRASAPAPAPDLVPTAPPPPDPLQPLPLWQQAVAGAAGGLSYNFLFFPADTIKSRMQTAAIGGRGEAAHRRSFWSEGAVLWRQYGLKGMYRGCGITCLRSAPSSAFIFIVYDGLKVQMQRQQQLWP